MAKIVKTASGKFSCRLYLGMDSSKHKKYKMFTHSDKRILKSIVAEFESANRTMASLDTFAACLERYINDRDGIASPSTIRGYKSIQRVLEKDFSDFCSASLASISRQDVQKVMSDLQSKGKSGKYIKNIHGLISGVLIANDYQSPKVSLPSSKAKHVYEPSKDDIHRTLKAARGTDMEIPILLGIHGLRRSEICALRYPDDFEGNVIHIRHAIVYGEKNKIAEKDTKTDESDRLVPLSEECYQKIVEQGYVTHKTLAAITQAFTRLLKRNGIPKYRFHDLRHFFASYMHENGFSDAQIMKMGGWKTDAVMKNIYRYALPDEKLSDKINSVFSNL